MQDRYAQIRSRILELAEADEGIKAVVAIGSSTRSEVKADEYSDLDLIIAAEDTEKWLYGDIPGRLGDVKISFVDPTLGGGKERRVLYNNALDVDMIVFTPEQLVSAVRDGVAGWVCNRGYKVLYDTMGIGEMLDEYVCREVKYSQLTEDEYKNIVNDFCFHVVWAGKKILRGELWTAKMCIDAYLKNHLLIMLEMYAVNKYKSDVWHDGRLLDRWADESIKTSLPKCFAHYDREDMIAALAETKSLFAHTAEEVAALKGFAYPKVAVGYADEVFAGFFDK
ncbi:MAG: aminoglycoside 6-adenylyltransferase [Oscillospiraceae bacterium]|nr:aminoglycoside 6-adenylyltransferase [Oscillospiraceae bacterium]